MRRRDQSILTRRVTNPIPDQDFTVADKYPEKERKIITPDVLGVVLRDQEKIANLGFVMPLTPTRRRQSAESRRTGAVSRARDISSQEGGISHTGIGFKSRVRSELGSGKAKTALPAAKISGAEPVGLWDRFMAWIKKIFGG